MTDPTPPILAVRLARTCAVASVLAMLCGLAGVVGWGFGITRLLSVARDAPALMPMSALGLFVAGAAFGAAIRRLRIAPALAYLVVIISAVAAIGYAFGTDFGFGGVPPGLPKGAGTIIGLPAPNSALALGLLGLALVLMRRAPVAAQTLALVAATIAYLAGLGELFGASTIQGLSAYTAMSPQTVLAMSSLAIGILCATPQAGVMPLLTDQGVAGLAVRRFLPVAIILPVILGGLRIAGEAIGLFDTRFGTALMAAASAALAGLLTFDIALAIRQLDEKLGREHSARTVADSESRVKDDVLSVLTEELRTPANIIHAQAHLLQAGVLTQERTRQVIEVVSRNAARLRQCVDDAAEVAAMAQGGVLIESEEVDPREPVRRALDRWKANIAAKEIALSTELMPVGFVNGDATRLQQIVSNLLSNAVKFTPSGGRIRVETLRDGERACLSVSDSGSGIAPEFLPFVFEPFRRSAPSHHENAEGLGLGLAIVRHLAELHGGTVAAFSEGVGQGARFVVHLPANYRSS
jgi:signal transduction histidine kinase